MKKKYFSIIFLALIYIATFITKDPSVKVMNQFLNTGGNHKEEKQIVIVIDPGHGGRDPGKVGINNTLEKDINLSIALKLKKLLQQNDMKVIMTRDADVGLYSDTDSNKKAADMNERVRIIKDNEADLAVSIHQNSYSQEYVKGAQVFYYTQSQQGKEMAEIIQNQLKKSIDNNNNRQAKANNSYYMLRKTECPLVIVECGYLTNYSESALLLQEDYQEKMAFAIHLGIMRYLNEKGKDSFRSETVALNK